MPRAPITIAQLTRRGLSRQEAQTFLALNARAGGLIETRARRRERATGVEELRARELRGLPGRFSRSIRRVPPVRTGNLRRSLRIRTLPRSFNVEWTAFYAKYVDRRGRSSGYVRRAQSRILRNIKPRYWRLSRGRRTRNASFRILRRKAVPT